MPESMGPMTTFALKKIASFEAVIDPMYPLFIDEEQDIFGADGVAVPQVRRANTPDGGYFEFVEEMRYLATTGMYKGHLLRPRHVSGRIHSMLISRSRRVASVIDHAIAYKGGLFSSDYIPPPEIVLPPAPEDEDRERWEDLLFEAAKVLDQDDQDNLFAEMLRLEDADL